MSSFFDHLETVENLLETRGNRASTFVIESRRNSTELNRIKRNRGGLRVAECGFAEYWNIKGCGYMSLDFNDKFREMSSIREGGFWTIAPQMRHMKNREDQS